MTTRLVIDTDAGIDDAVALMLALGYPGAQVEAITTVCGNVSVDKVNANVLTILDAVGRTDVPVYAGASQPLVSSWAAEPIHGLDGLGNYHDRPRVKQRVEAEHAAWALIRLADAYPGELTLVALAPHTNLALATRLDPTFPSKIKSLVFMGGTITARGNTDHIAAEWNIFCDPEAAFITLEAFPMAQMVSWETSLAFPLPAAEYQALIARRTPATRLFERIYGIFTSPGAEIFMRDPLLIDALAMAAALDPSVITDSMQRYVTVEMHGTHSRGQTVIDHTGRLKRPANVDIITGFDMARVSAMLFESMG
ncbi:MAG: nucleoside hydrolase [Pleurocapsa minor GSE-CHR-MK-17-07R]|jgi:purine nucleosidase|nr:nucleoside hydrolase [Pleurocapsa minor GSE-CHR-MK 17-07R]